jgi:lipopolysaccharide export system permease protein
MLAPRLLDLYVLRRYVVALAFSILSLVLIAIVIDLTENIDTFIDFSARPSEILLYYAYHTPYWMVLTLPIAALLGTLFALTSLARGSEITAMKAVGISLYRILLPVFACALVVSVVAFAFTDRIVPAATYQYNQIRDQITSYNRPDGSRRQVLLQDVDGQLLFARTYDAANRRARDVAYERRLADRLVERINGRKMEWQDDHWRVLDGTTYTPGTTAPGTFGVDFDTLSLTSVTLTPLDLARQQKRPEEMNYAELSRYIQRAAANGEDAARHRVDLHLKVAFPLTCFIIVLLGAPLGANAKRSGMASSFGLGIAVCFVYYSCVKAGQALGWNQVISPWAGAWAANLIFGVLGLVLLWRAHK